MRPADPVFHSTRDHAKETICVRHETPEGKRLILSLRSICWVTLFVVIGIGVVLVLNDTSAVLTDGQRMVAMSFGIATSFALAQSLAAWAAERRFGLRMLLDRRWQIALSRDGVQFEGAIFARGPKLAFTAEPHRWGRREERAERLSRERIEEIYRSAAEVRLQYGEQFLVLAEVSDEKSAHAIVRRLQARDEALVRGTHRVGDDHAFGLRQQPD